MKHKLVNRKTGEEHFCQKIVIDGFDYYVSDEFIEEGNFAINLNTKEIRRYDGVKGMDSYWKKVIATNNPNIDIPKVVDDVERLKLVYNEGGNKDVFTTGVLTGIEIGYNKSQETHPFSEEDIIKFDKYKSNLISTKKEDYPLYMLPTDSSKWLTTKELLQIWKEQQPKIVYYE